MLKIKVKSMEHQTVTKTNQLALRGSAPSPARPAPATSPSVHPLLQLAHRLGNRGVGRLIQAKFKISQPEDAHEQEADQMADQVMTMPAPSGYSERQGFPPSRLAFIESRFATNFSGVRAGLIRKVVHGPSVIQRQSSGSQTPPAITARAIFPFPQGSRVVLNRIMPETWFRMLSSLQPQIGAALQAVESQVATVTTASDDLFEAALSGSISLPAQDNSPAVTLSNVTLRLQRQPTGTFNFELSGRTDPQASPTILFEQRDLTARAEAGTILLSSGAQPQLAVSPGASVNQVRIEAFTAPYLSQVPSALRGLVPERLALLGLTQLPDVRPGTAEEQQAIRTVAAEVAGQRRERRQRFLVGGGIQFGAQANPLLAASWQVSFMPIQRAGGLFQVPLELQLQYAPSSSVLAEASTGAEVSLAQLNIPINVRLVNLGLAGGTVQGSAPDASSARPVLPAFGPTIGAGAGLELGAFRVDLRYEHLFNLLQASPNADSLLLRVGGAF